MDQFLGFSCARKEPQDLYYRDSASQSHFPKYFEIIPQILKTHTQNYFETAPQMFKVHSNDPFLKDFDTSPPVFISQNKYLQKEFEMAPQEFKTHNNVHFQKFGSTNVQGGH